MTVPKALMSTVQHSINVLWLAFLFGVRLWLNALFLKVFTSRKCLKACSRTPYFNIFLHLFFKKTTLLNIDFTLDMSSPGATDAALIQCNFSKENKNYC